MGTIENKELIFVLVLFGGVVCTYLLYLMHTQATLWPKKIPKAKGYRRSRYSNVWRNTSECEDWPFIDYEEVPFGTAGSELLSVCPRCDYIRIFGRAGSPS